MLRYLFIPLFLFSQNISAQQIFQKTYGNSLDDWFWDLEVVNDTDVYVVGYTRENDQGNNTILLCLLNSSSNIEWSKTINVGYGDFGFKINKLVNNTLLIMGETEDYIPPGDNDALLINVDLDGNILWKKNWGTTTHERLEKCLETSDNFLISVGFVTYFTSYIWSGLKITKTDLNGNIIWDKTKLFDASTLSIDIEKVNDIKYLISGATRITDSSDYNMLLAVMDSAGNIIWGKGYGGNNDEYSAYISKSTYGGAIIATTSFSYNIPSGNGDILVVRTDSLGNVIWSKKYGDSGHEQIKGIIQDTSDNYIIWGSSTSYYPSFPGTGLVFKIDGNGDVIWSNLYGRANIEVLLGLEQWHDQLLICGQTRSPLPPANLDGYLIKTNWQGISGCNDSIIALPYEDVIVNTYILNHTDTIESFTENPSFTDPVLTIQTHILCDTITGTEEIIASNNLILYPNPNEGRFSIILPEEKPLESLKVYNMLGEEIKYEKMFSNRIIELTLPSISSGLYTINLVVGNNLYTIKTLIH